MPRALAQQHTGFVKAGLTGYAYVRTDTQLAWPATLAIGTLPAGGSYEFSLSDGLNTVRVPQAR